MADTANSQEFTDALAERLANIADADAYDDAALQAFAEELVATAAGYQDAALTSNDPEAAAIILACAAAHTQIGEESTRRATEKAEAAERTNAALTALGVAPEGDPEEGGDGTETLTTQVATASVKIVPDLTDFEAQVRAQVGTLIRTTFATDLSAATDDELVAELAARAVDDAVQTATDAGTAPTADEVSAAQAAAAAEAATVVADLTEDASDALAGVNDEATETEGGTAPMATDPTPPIPDHVAPPTAPTQEATLSTETPTDDTPIDLSNLPDPAAAMSAATGDLAPQPGGGTMTLTAQPVGVERLWAQPRTLRPLSRQAEFTTAEPVRFADMGMNDPTAKDAQISDKTALAKMIGTKFDQVKRMELARPGQGKIYMAHADAPPLINEATGMPERLGGDPIANMDMLQGNQRRFQSELMAVAASGGNCAIPMNNYDVFNAATVQSPVEAFLRAINADRGGMRYLSAPNWADAQAGVQVTTDAEDAAGYTNQTPPGPTTPKVCVHFDCPEELECIVDAVSACAEFGNLSYRTATELVVVLLDQLAVAHAQAKEITYLDAIQAGSTAVTGDVDGYGANRSIVWSLGNAAWAYRKRNHIGRSMPIDVLLPDTVIPILKADAVADLHLGMEFLGVDQETLSAQLMDSMNLNVEFYYDYSTSYGAVNAMQNAQGPGNIGNWPISFEGYIYAPGTWVRLDGGTLDVGLVRDSTLNSQNNLQLFSEEWVQACKVGYESVAFTFALCPSGEGPDPVTGRPCTS